MGLCEANNVLFVSFKELGVNMKKEEWIEVFEEIHGRIPSVEEVLAAEKAGEIIGNLDAEVVSVNYNQAGSARNSSNGYGYRKNSLFSYLKFCYENKKWAILAYFSTLIGLGLCLAVWPGILAILLSMFMISETGQNMVCKMISAKPIERQEYQSTIVQPITKIIQKEREQGLILPESIEIRIIQNELPVAYAVGMNRILVSESLLDSPHFLESKIKFELHRIHNMAPNLLLVVVGANILLVLAGLIVMLSGSLDKNYGDRRSSFWTGGRSQAANGAILYYGSLAALAAILGLTFLFVKSVVRRDVELSDGFMVRQGLGQVHCLYLDKVNTFDQTMSKKVFELGFPDIDTRIAVMQNQHGVNYQAN